jgi:outer membrane protein assembly factor BamB
MLISALTLAAIGSAVAAQPGQKLWEFQTGGMVYACPGVGLDGTVYIGAWDKRVYALDGATGARKWSFATGGGVYSSPAIGPDGTVYVGSYDAFLYALDGATGARKWAVRIPDAGNPALGADGTLYLGSRDGTFHALDSATGTQKWVVDVRARSYGDSAYCDPAVGADGTVYATAATPFDPPDPGPGPFIGTLYALDGRTGAHKWSWVTPLTYQAYGPRNPVIGANGTVYSSWWDGTESEGKLAKLSAFDGATGVMKWAFAVAGLGVSPVAVGVDGTVYFGAEYPGEEWVLYALDGVTGAQRWAVPRGEGFGDSSPSSPAIAADGTVYVGGNEGRFLAFDGATGAQKWSFATGPAPPYNSRFTSAPTITASGTVVFGASDGMLYALQGSAGLADSPWPKFHHDARNTGRRGFVPWVFEQLSRVVLGEGATGQIAVELDVAPAPTFRWFLNGQPIAGVTQAALTIPSVTRADEGTYTVVASNCLGQATSQPIVALVSNVDPQLFPGLKWEGTVAGSASLEATAQLGEAAMWHSISNYPPSATSQVYVELDPADAARFYRLNGAERAETLRAGFIPGWWFTQPTGTTHQIEYVSSATGWTNWQVLTNLTLPARPHLFLDTEAIDHPGGVYRTTPVP